MSDERKVTITSVMQTITEAMCDNYCKYQQEYRDRYGDPDIAFEMMLEEQCQHCPLQLM